MKSVKDKIVVVERMKYNFATVLPEIYVISNFFVLFDSMLSVFRNTLGDKE